jgi:hypothetical protein
MIVRRRIGLEYRIHASCKTTIVAAAGSGLRCRSRSQRRCWSANSYVLEYVLEEYVHVCGIVRRNARQSAHGLSFFEIITSIALVNMSTDRVIEKVESRIDASPGAAHQPASRGSAGERACRFSPQMVARGHRRAGRNATNLHFGRWKFGTAFLIKGRGATRTHARTRTHTPHIKWC